MCGHGVCGSGCIVVGDGVFVVVVGCGRADSVVVTMLHLAGVKKLVIRACVFALVASVL